MNKAVLVCAIVALVVFGGLLLLKNHGTTKVPYYIPQQQAFVSPVPSKSIFQDPPTVDQITKDLAGKTVTINGKSHQFAGPELNYMNILSSKDSDNGVVVDVQICADITIVEKAGILRTRYSHENVCGSMRIYYEKKGDQWNFRMVENIDLQKMITPNSKAPPSGNQVFRHVK